MNKIEFMKEIRAINFNIQDIKEDNDGNLHLGLYLAKTISDKVWEVKDNLK